MLKLAEVPLMVRRPLYLSTVILLILTAIYSIYIYIYQYIVHSKMVLKSLNSLEGELCKGYLAHFKLSLFFFLCYMPSLSLFKEWSFDGLWWHECAEPAGQVCLGCGIKCGIKDLVYGDTKALRLLECLWLNPVRKTSNLNQSIDSISRPINKCCRLSNP